MLCCTFSIAFKNIHKLAPTVVPSPQFIHVWQVYSSTHFFCRSTDHLMLKEYEAILDISPPKVRILNPIFFCKTENPKNTPSSIKLIELNYRDENNNTFNGDEKI